MNYSMEEYKQFITSKTYPLFSTQLQLEDYAKQNNIPIISRDSLDLLLLLIKTKKPKRILELGTAIGYSAIAMAMCADKDTRIISIERDELRYQEALSNIQSLGLEQVITVYNSDIFEAKEILTGETFDMVFIDAAKGQYQSFFDMVFPITLPGGIIISDNIFFKGIVLGKDEKNIEKRNRTIYKRMNAYLDFLKGDERLFTSLVPIGDGIAITYKI